MYFYMALAFMYYKIWTVISAYYSEYHSFLRNMAKNKMHLYNSYF